MNVKILEKKNINFNTSVAIVYKQTNKHDVDSRDCAIRPILNAD